MNTTPDIAYASYHANQCAARFRYASKQVAHTAQLLECAERLLAEAQRKHASALSTAGTTRDKLAEAQAARAALLAASK